MHKPHRQTRRPSVPKAFRATAQQHPQTRPGQHAKNPSRRAVDGDTEVAAVFDGCRRQQYLTAWPARLRPRYRALNRLQNDYGVNVSHWTWGSAHNALSAHKPFGNVALLAKFFDVREPTGGDTYTVNVGQYWANDDKLPFANRHAASMRTLFDLADLEKSQFIYQTGQSGLVFSSRYRDMSAAWASVQYRPLQMQPTAMKHELRLVP